MADGGARRARWTLAGATVALVVAGVAAFGPTLVWLARSWGVHPYYSHGPLLVALAAWFVWRRRDRLGAASPSLVGLVLVLGGALVAVAAAPREAQDWSAAGLILTLLGVAGLWGGLPAIAASLYPAGLLALAVPLPAAERAAPLLSAQVARLAASAAGALGTPVLRAGVELSVADGTYAVGGPCSGLRSLLALVSLAYVAVGLLDTSLSRRTLVVLAAVPIALVANWIRLTGLLVFTHHFGSAAGLRIFEGPASPALFLVGAAILVAAGQRLGKRT